MVAKLYRIGFSVHDYFKYCEVRDSGTFSKGTSGSMLVCNSDDDKHLEVSIEDNGRLMNFVAKAAVTGHIYTK